MGTGIPITVQGVPLIAEKGGVLLTPTMHVEPVLSPTVQEMYSIGVITGSGNIRTVVLREKSVKKLQEERPVWTQIL